jgi:uncharacterized radical SAM superfamily Fe-S cluster-containing enzyme
VTMTDHNRLTQSLCPVCLSAVPAMLLAEGEVVALEGRCPDHGVWRTPVWSGSPSMESWCGDDRSGGTELDRTDGQSRKPVATKCPGACGLCPQHQQHTCTAVIEITRKCDLGCPLCFAESSATTAEADPSFAQLVEMLQGLFAVQGAVNLQLSGGEPSLRDDLPEIIAAACALGFTFVQLNTNGLRLASDPGYADELRSAGLASVFLQFDGVTDHTYQALRGRPLAAQKLQALERCAEAGLAVVLVPTVVPGVNDHEIGSLVHLAARWPGTVRGLHLQPVSYFGRYTTSNRPRLTLPEVLRLLEQQTSGDVRADDFAASCCEHSRCSFRARYWVRDDGRLELVRTPPSCCPPQPGGAARLAIASTSRQWSRRSGRETVEQTAPRDDLGRFLDAAGKIMCISGMLFQDAWSLDLERVRRCCVHVVVPSRGLVPFCLWNLTSESGRRLYPRC